MQFELVEDGFGAIEAPRVAADGARYFTDIQQPALYRHAPDGSLRKYLEGRVNIGGIVFNQDGRLICSGRGGLLLLDPATGVAEPLLTAIEGQPLDVVNDIHTDDAGSIYGGTLDYTALAEHRQPRPGVLFRLDPDHTLTILNREVSVSNGIGFSPDRTRLYHSDTSAGIWAYDLDAARAVSNRRLFASLPGSDGMCVDAEGHVWAACYATREIIRFTPAGVVERRYGFEEPAVLSVVFGGPDLRDLYVATACDWADPGRGLGRLYRARSDIAGQALPLARF